MIEIPEAITLSYQVNKTLKGKKVVNVIANQSPHKFVWYCSDLSEYNSKLDGKIIDSANAYGGFVEISLGDTKILFNDGVNLIYLGKGEKHPQKHQLLIQFEDDSILVA